MAETKRRVPWSDNDLLEMIKKFIDKNGYSPTVRELCKLVDGVSTSTMHSALNRLEKAKRISWMPKSARTLQIVETDKT